ncbi:hypothetical protein Pan241w_38050 [Gimesia alba]|uniref:Uncharacterized protein n=1 Tax=Gimesia alba TaxID=2527973 RepID=A0A517RIL9_9PLAN|nr:hypothetical protein [Gimesia alba]QDT43703.1 hypothetical protein Pan241w_38050 [Gimesia alba]
MKLISKRNWQRNYRQTVIDLIHECFPPNQYLAEIDGPQLVRSEGPVFDEILCDFAGKTWDQLDHTLITHHQDAPLFMSYEGFLKFLPAFLIDLFREDTQVLHIVWNSLLEFRFEVRPSHSQIELNNDQILCCILSFVRSSNFPLDTMIPRRTAEEYFHNPSPEAAFNMLTLGLSHERIATIQSQIEQINDCFVIERWDQG